MWIRTLAVDAVGRRPITLYRRPSTDRSQLQRGNGCHTSHQKASTSLSRWKMAKGRGRRPWWLHHPSHPPSLSNYIITSIRQVFLSFSSSSAPAGDLAQLATPAGSYDSCMIHFPHNISLLLLPYRHVPWSLGRSLLRPDACLSSFLIISRHHNDTGTGLTSIWSLCEVIAYAW